MKEVVNDLNGGSFVYVVDYTNGYQTLAQEFTYQDACDIRELEIMQSQEKEGSMVKKGSNLLRIVDFQ